MKPNTGDERKMGDMPTRGDSKMAQKPHMTAPIAKMDHKAAIAKMHPEHLHNMVMAAHSGKFGPDAQTMAEKAMTSTPTGGGPNQDSGASGETNNSPKRSNPFMGADDEQQDEMPSAASMFAGSRSM